VTEIASPMGVVFGMIPLTNPVSTFVFKTLICLKARNALIVSCHRDALGVGNRTGEIIQAVLQQHGASVDLVQWIRQRSSRRKTTMFMKHPGVAFILATGGPSMVKAAYSSGTPAIGVGSGNAPVWICADADLAAAAQMVVQSKAFDNGVICGSENNLVVEASVRAAFVEQLEACGGRLLTPQEKESCAQTIFDFDNHTVQRAFVGKSAQFIAQQAGLPYDGTLRLLVIPAAAEEMSGPYGHEKLAPVLSLFTAHGEAEGLEMCRAILAQEGSGHTAVVHTRSQALAEQFSLRMPVSRILVNTPGAQGCIGLGNGLTPSLTLGCGTYGRNSITDNVTYTHLLNIKRMALSLGAEDQARGVESRTMATTVVLAEPAPGKGFVREQVRLFALVNNLSSMSDERWPALPYDAWKDTYATLHMWTQVVGRWPWPWRRAQPLLGHQPAPHLAGLSTQPLAHGERTFAMEFDFVRHRLFIQAVDGVERAVALLPRTVADFHREVMTALDEMGLGTRVWTVPAEVLAPIRFEEDTVHASYDLTANRFCAHPPPRQACAQPGPMLVRRQVQPGPFFWEPSTWRSRASPGVRSASRRARVHARGVLARGDQPRLLAGSGRPGTCALRLRGPGAGRLQGGTREARRGLLPP
jgi:acyl-CoA reductase-like NAD-dependent aldehyde dehydrogenase